VFHCASGRKAGRLRKQQIARTQNASSRQAHIWRRRDIDGYIARSAVARQAVTQTDVGEKTNLIGVAQQCIDTVHRRTTPIGRSTCSATLRMERAFAHARTEGSAS